MSLLSIFDLKFYSDKTMNKTSLFLIEALNRMKNKRQFHQEEYEDVICPFQLMLILNEVANDFDNKRGNENAVR